MNDFFDESQIKVTNFLIQVRKWNKVQCSDYLIHSGIIDSIISNAQSENPRLALMSMEEATLKSFIVSHAQSHPEEF